jgi:hypothetical protein
MMLSLQNAAQGFETVENQATDAINQYSVELSEKHPPKDVVTEEYPYKYTYYDDKRKAWVTVETKIVHHTYPDYYSEQFDKTTIDRNEENNGIYTHTKTVTIKNIMTYHDLTDWINDKDDADAQGGALFDGMMTFALLTTGPLSGLLTSLGILVFRNLISEYKAPPFDEGFTKTVTGEEKEVKYPDGITEKSETATFVIQDKQGDTRSKVITEHAIQQNPDGSIEKYSTASESYSQDGIIESRVTEETRTTINNGELLIERYTITETFNPDGSVKSTDTQKDILDHKLI